MQELYNRGMLLKVSVTETPAPLFAVAELGVFEQQKFFAVIVEADAGLHVGIAAGDFENHSGAEAYMLDALADAELGHGHGLEVRVDDGRNGGTR